MAYNEIGSHKTVITQDEDGTRNVILHSTTIVKTHPDGTVTLDSGGYTTPVTKRRMNQVANAWNLKFGVYQKNHEWFVSLPGGDIPFEDGMRI